MFWSDPQPNYPLYLAIISVIGLLVTLGLRYLYRATWNSSVIWRAVALGVGSYIGGLIWMACRSFIFYDFYPDEAKKMAAKTGGDLFYLFESAISAGWVLLVWSALYIGIKYYLVHQEDQQRYLKAVSMAHEAQLKMLRYQLNPHFLFNTLNAISTLILDKDNDLANSMVTKLSRFLRYSLDNDPMQQVTVEEEVESLKLYLDIEQVRFADRLRLYFDIATIAEQALMPSLLLQPLVENSIKYAISTSVEGGFIKVSADVVDGHLQLIVADDGPGMDLNHEFKSHPGSGVGLENTTERLQELYQKNFQLALEQTVPHGLTVRIAIPLAYPARRSLGKKADQKSEKAA